LTSGIEISYDAPQSVRAALKRMARTEDVRFSPNNRRLALADLDRNSTAIVDVDITIGGNRPQVTVTDVAELSSPCLNSPHGVDFLDDETIIVANRGGNVTVLRLPSDDSAVNRAELTPIDPPPGRGFELLSAPSALAVAGDPDGGIEVLICNNSGNTITRHTLHDDPLAVTTSDVLLHRWLDVPDGVAVSADDQWIAVSNHSTHTVMLYERSSSLHESSDPDGILRGASYPHGLRFSADARHLFVADAGRPYVHVYARDGEAWRGVQHPAASLRVMDDDVFQLGLRTGPEHGGPKGIDIDRHGHVLAMTSVCQPLAFFDVSAILDRNTGRCRDHALQMSYELEILEQARVAEARIAALEGSKSFRMTKPLRRLKATLSRRRR
jgi:DNA-binding beta-propeller fold protein YncE